MESTTRAAIDEWHRSVGSGEREASLRAVGDPVVVLGPRGAGRLTPAQFADWVERSGISLVPVSWHPVSDRLVVVEQDATWPGTEEPVRVATVFRVAGGKVTAALRLPDLRSALELAQVHHELSTSD